MHLDTAKRHFEDDISRSRALCHHTSHCNVAVKGDILRASWMFAVGGVDAYFSDAYADLIARTLRAKELEPSIQMPERLSKLKVPVVAIIRKGGGGWRWRMAARELIEDENVLSLDKIRKLFNHFFRKKSRILKQGTLEPWLLHADARVRCFGITQTKYRTLSTNEKTIERERALEKFEERIAGIFQRRHDCIHNCDRPKVSVQAITKSHVVKITDDLCFLVERTHHALISEYPNYLKGLGFKATTRNQVCL